MLSFYLKRQHKDLPVRAMYLNEYPHSLVGGGDFQFYRVFLESVSSNRLFLFSLFWQLLLNPLGRGGFLPNTGGSGKPYSTKFIE